MLKKSNSVFKTTTSQTSVGVVKKRKSPTESINALDLNGNGLWSIDCGPNKCGRDGKKKFKE